jgi:long-chain-fatty-acid---luciferin-component ligase
LSSVELLIQNSNPFQMDFGEVQKLRFDAIKESFIHHYSNNTTYRRFCDKYNVNPAIIQNNAYLLRIPLLPSDFFKELSISQDPDDIKKIASVPEGQIFTYFTTSGTTGKPSKYPFDRKSLDATMLSGIKIFTSIGSVREDDHIIMLTPPPNESVTGLVQGMYMCMKMLLKGDDKIKFAIKAGVFDEKLTTEMISSTEAERTHLYGPPFLFNALADYILRTGNRLRLGQGSKVFTTGGWKRVEGEINKNELYRKIAKATDIQMEDIRDGLGLTDIFTILLECEHHKKHIPPWLHVSIRNTTVLSEEMGLGRPGLIAFMSPLIESYPAFVITGDMGQKTHEERCTCGRIGPTIEYLRRADGLAARGCAIVLDSAIKAMRTTP